jgi:hypothetical protein
MPSVGWFDEEWRRFLFAEYENALSFQCREHSGRIRMLKKPKPSRDRRRIATSRVSSDFDYEPLKTHDWNFIQVELGQKLGQTLREYLSAITMTYAAAAKMPRSTRSITGIVQEIDLWQRQTKALIKKVWNGPIRPKTITENLTLKQISQEYFQFPENLILSASYPLSRFAYFLEGVVAVSSYFIRLLEDPAFKGEPKTQLWLIWAAMIIKRCQDSGIEVTKSKTEGRKQNKNQRELNPGFIFLLRKLQDTLTFPNDKNLASVTTQSHIRSSIGVPFKRGDSLTKNAKRALVLAEKTDVEHLLILYLMWSVGLTQFGTGRLYGEELKPLFALLNEQMKIISPMRSDLTG